MLKTGSIQFSNYHAVYTGDRYDGYLTFLPEPEPTKNDTFSLINAPPALEEHISYRQFSGKDFCWFYEGLGQVSSFLNDLFGTTGIAQRSLTHGGSMYPLLNVDDAVLNGPFGDARGKLWGEDASTSIGITGLPTGDVTIYSYGQVINRTYS